MANDLRLHARRAVVACLRGSPAVAAAVPADRIYGPETPDAPLWPFVRYGSASVLPDRATCLDGSLITVSLHVFAKGPGEDRASAIAAAIGKALDGAVLTDDDGHVFEVTWTGGQTLRDTDEASAWHCTVDLEIVAS